MSKIICDICGTVYPDSANACPICGFPGKNSEKTVEEESVTLIQETETVDDQPKGTKGGRFSNKNVKKRNKAEADSETRRERRREAKEEKQEQKQEKKKGGKGSAILVVFLSIAVVATTGYILWRFWNGRDAYDNPKAPIIGTNPSEIATQPVETEPVETGVPCVGVIVSDTSVEFHDAGKSWKLSVTLTPEDTTEELTFTSSDEAVVTVTSDGRITSVGPGEATITITCGAVTRECQIFCDFQPETQPEETTEPAETTEPVEPNDNGFELDRTDVTLFEEGEQFTFKVTFNGETVSPASVEWKSEDPAVATVENGKVTAVADGKTNIIATYQGQTLKCVVRCRFESATETTEKTYSDNHWRLSAKYGDVTLVINEYFELKLINDAGEVADVTWTSSNPGVVSIDGNTIKGKAAGYTEVSATIGGQTYTCVVRVKTAR